MEAKIPKVIHYIWLGTRDLDKISLKCMKTWEKYLSDYKIERWDDDRCLEIINNNIYAKQAFELKKYAFVSDYLRLYILYNYGGIYMDTDVEVYKSLNCFLNQEAFSCFENRTDIPTALLASSKGNEWIKMLLDDYNDREFVDSNGNMDLRTNVERITELSIDWGLRQNGEEQVLKSGVHIYTKDYFCPIDTMNKKMDLFTENTYAAHLYNSSWTSPMRKKLSNIKKFLGIDPKKICGEKLYNILRKL